MKCAAVRAGLGSGKQSTEKLELESVTHTHVLLHTIIGIDYRLASPSPALPRLSLWRLGLVELVASNIRDLSAIRTTTDVRST